MKSRFFLFNVLLLLFANNLLATNYYVSTSGSNSNPGTLALPWRTINYAVNFNSLSAGDYIYLRGGTYNERVIMLKSGSNAGRITVTKYQSENPIMDGTNLSWSYDGVTALFEVKGSYVTIDGLSVKNVTANGDSCGITIKGPNVSNVTIRNCYTERTQSSGISCWGNSGFGTYTGATDIIIELNTIVNAVNDGYQEHLSVAGGVERCEVRYNTVRDGSQNSQPRSPNIPLGIDMKVNVRNSKIYQNTVYNLPYGASGIYVDGWDDHVYNIDIYSNIVHNVSGGGISIGAEEGGITNNVNIFNNLIYNCSGNGFGINQQNSATQNSISFIKFYNNTVYGSGQYAAHITNRAATNIVIKNNIFSQNSWSNSVTLFPVIIANVDVGYNITDGVQNAYLPGTQYVLGTGSISSNPQFAFVGGNNFRLQSASSPAVNVATSTLVPSVDLDGNSRPSGGAYDIGAYEFGSTLGNINFSNSILNTALYPNPSSFNTTLTYNLLETDKIEINIYDSLGKKIKNLVNNDNQLKGKYELNIDTEQLNNGIYFIKLNTNSSQSLQKLVVKK
jgi:Secretion system C-terminal sorting domain/Right handed beta helix region